MIPLDTGHTGGQNVQPFDPDLESAEYGYIQQALDSEKGIKLTFGTHNEAVNMRHRIYRLRKRLAAKGSTSLGLLTITLEGNVLTMYKISAIVEEL
jgi:hypothetical protein